MPSDSRIGVSDVVKSRGRPNGRAKALESENAVLRAEAAEKNSDQYSSGVAPVAARRVEAAGGTHGYDATTVSLVLPLVLDAGV